MTATECPRCGKPTAAHELTCKNCGWPDGAEGTESSDGSSPPEATAPPAEVEAAQKGSMGMLLVGFGAGLLAGLLAGWVLGKNSVVPATGPTTGAGVAAAAPDSGGLKIAKPDPLRLREMEWRQGEGNLCTGVFQVLSAPPTILGLEMTVMDGEGKAIASDRVKTASGLKPFTVIELGFEVGTCSKIRKWHVKVIAN